MTIPKNDSANKAIRLYEKAQDAFNRNNPDYAISLLFATLKVAPNYVKARHLIRLITKKNLEQSKSIFMTRIIGNIVSIPSYITGLFFYLKNNHQDAILSFEKVLIKDPVNTFVLRFIGSSAEKLEMTETAVEIYETIRILSPSNIKNLHVLGNIYKDDVQDLGKAQECFSEIIQYNRNSHFARKGLSDIAALQTIEAGKYDDTSSSFLSKVKDLEYTDITEKKMRTVKSKEDLKILIKDTEAKHLKNPNNVQIILELASYMLEIKEFDNAISCYTKAQTLSPEDYTLTKRIMETEIIKIEDSIFTLTKQTDKTPEIKQQIKELSDLKTQTIFQHLTQMVFEQPSDRELRFRLGFAYFEYNMIDEAIKEFQIAVKEPRYRLKSYNLLGLCFHEKQMYDLAEVQFNTALEELRKGGQMDTFTKKVIYNLAHVYEKMGQMSKAVEKYKEIYKVDIGFKDVSTKINKTYQ